MVDSEISDEIISSLVSSNHIINLAKIEPFVLAKSVCILGLEVGVRVVVDKVLTNIAQRYHILQLVFKLYMQHLELAQLCQLFLRQHHLLLEVDVLHLLPMELLQKTAIGQH